MTFARAGKSVLRPGDTRKGSTLILSSGSISGVSTYRDRRTGVRYVKPESMSFKTFSKLSESEIRSLRRVSGTRRVIPFSHPYGNVDLKPSLVQARRRQFRARLRRVGELR